MLADAAKDVLRFIARSHEPTDYQLDRYVMSKHGPEAVGSVAVELRDGGFAERFSVGEYSR